MNSLRKLEQLRRMRVVEPIQGCLARVDGQTAVLMCSNDYLGLASRPELIDAVGGGARRWAVGAGASRLISGTLPIHLEAERRLAEFVSAEAALLFASGYQANV